MLRYRDGSGPGIWLTILGFSRRERELYLDLAVAEAREAGGCKPLLASPQQIQCLGHAWQSESAAFLGIAWLHQLG